jgi:hypothetical protein
MADVQQLVSSLKPKAFGGSLVRFGPESDGGYLLPDDLDGVSACISPGVSTECGFDRQIADRGIPVFLLDASVPSAPVHHDQFRFFPLFLGSRTASEFVTIDDFYQKHLESKHDEDLLLQMDIEGAELDVIDTISDALLKKFRIMVIEFHHLEHIFEPMGFARFSRTFDRLSQFHEVVHIHPNNHSGTARSGSIEIPKLLEITYYRKDRSNFSESKFPLFPHPLDASNVPDRSPLALPKCWYT